MHGPNNIEQLLPHRYPFLLVDRILAVRQGEWICGEKSFSSNDIWVGAQANLSLLACESLAQLSKALDQLDLPEHQRGGLSLLVGMDLTFGKPVHPGDRVELQAQIDRRFGPMACFAVEAKVKGEKVVSGTLIRRLKMN